MKIKKLTALSVIFVAIVSAYAQKNDMKQVMQSVEMLNYISTLSERIKENKDNRLQLNQIRDEIYNNIIPSSIDARTQEIITGSGGFLDSIQSYQLIGLQRERLEYVAEKQRAQALKSAIPDPIYVLSIMQAKNPMKMVVSIVATTASSALNYNAAKNALELENMQQTWELDDKESSVFEDQRKQTFDYMITISRKFNMPKEFTLSEENIKDFVRLQSDTNLNKRLSELEKEDNSKLYLGAKYGPYYLLLANTYYELDQYQKCIDIFEAYENRNVRVFRKDYDAARVIPKVINSARQVYSTKRYIEAAKKYLNLLKQETTDKNWELRYFVALTYIELAELDSANHDNYLKMAAESLLSNISYLAGEQELDLKKYAEPVNESIPKGIKKKDEKVTKSLIKKEKKERKNALPPLREPLYLNCELLNQIKSEYKISDSDWNNKFLKVTTNAILNKSLRKDYGFYEPTSIIKDNIWSNVEEAKQKVTNDYVIMLPAVFFAEDSKISIKFFYDYGKSSVIMTNLPYEIKEIKRPKSRDLKLPEDVVKYIDEFNAEISLDLKDYKVKFSDFDSALITVESYGKKISIIAKKDKK